QTPTQTPTPVVQAVVSNGQTPDIAATLTVEAQATLIDVGEEIVLVPMIGAAPATDSASPTARTTPTPGPERLSPPTLNETATDVPALEVAIVPTLPQESMAQSADPSPAQTDTDTSAVALNAPDTTRPQVQVDQPTANVMPQRTPYFLALSWITFVAAVVLVFTSWWLRREP
ncbi:MAG: hypothetical protein KDD84_15310, partial [Caldilineaceae bacterium]|nr:hypothetical protein [Caldilineaceae bacterium]